jgi:hypothetical protein
VDLPYQVGASLKKGMLEGKEKNRIKGYLEGGSGGSKCSSKAAENQNEKTKKMVRGKVPCSNCGVLRHEKMSCKCPFNGTKKK